MPRSRRGGLRRHQTLRMISLQVNGKKVELDQPTSLLDYLERLGVNPRTVAVEHNGEIIPRTSFTRVTFRDGDTVEIVRMVGGGSRPSPQIPLPDGGGCLANPARESRPRPRRVRPTVPTRARSASNVRGPCRQGGPCRRVARSRSRGGWRPGGR